jgi:hypothetical protein
MFLQIAIIREKLLSLSNKYVFSSEMFWYFL